MPRQLVNQYCQTSLYALKVETTVDQYIFFDELFQMAIICWIVLMSFLNPACSSARPFLYRPTCISSVVDDKMTCQGHSPVFSSDSLSCGVITAAVTFSGLLGLSSYMIANFKWLPPYLILSPVIPSLQRLSLFFTARIASDFRISRWWWNCFLFQFFDQ